MARAAAFSGFAAATVLATASWPARCAATLFVIQPGRAMQSPSKNAMISPRATFIPRLRAPPGINRTGDSITCTPGKLCRTRSPVLSPPDVATITSKGSSQSCWTREETTRTMVSSLW